MFGDCFLKMLLTLTGVVTFPVGAAVLQSEFMRPLHFDMNSSHIQEINYFGMTILQCLRKCHGDGQCLSLLQNQTNGSCKILHGYLTSSESEGPRDIVYFVTGRQAHCMMAGFFYSIKYDICYLVSDVKMVYRKQLEYCQEHGSSLLRVDSGLKQYFLQEVSPGVILQIDGSLYQEEGNNTWRYSDGTEMATYYWADGQPHSSLERDCIIAEVGSRLWVNKDCGYKRLFICERY